jgi:hypothetical protein
MNPGAIEEGVKVASGVVEGLKAQPLSLALIVMNIVFIGFSVWVLQSLNARTVHQYEVKDQLIAKLIDKCRDPQSTSQ